MKDKDGVHISENIQVKLELTPRVKKELITLKELLEEYTPRDVALHGEQKIKNDVL
jgi:antitoxin component of MazEF toxin-antitoxin module